MQDLVYIGIDRAGLEEARRDVERHAAKVAAELKADPEAVRIAFTCDDMWPMR